MGWTRRFAALCCIAGILTLGSASPRAQDYDEYDIKASFIYNFVKFVEWPGGQAISKQSAVDVCILGDSELWRKAAFFRDKASTPKLRISLVREKDAAGAGHCHIVFIGMDEAKRLSEILAALKDKAILTVSDIDNFADRGGMIGFTLADDKVKLVINPKAAAANGLRIDAQLLEIALKVIDR